MSKNRVTPRRPSGFPEYLPAEQLAFNRMLSTIRSSYEAAGFGPIETPALELSEVLLAKGGGETEQEVFRFGKGSKDYTLHYDLTVPFARYVAEHQNDLAFPFRRSQIQKVWRAERPQKGRAREFYQCDADVVGESDVAIDGELIALAAATMRALDCGSFKIRLNNRKLLTGVYEVLGVGDKSTDVLRVIDKIEKIGRESVEKLLGELGLDKAAIDQLLKVMSLRGPVDTVLETLRTEGMAHNTFIRGLEELERVVRVARAAGVQDTELEIDCSIARGLDYYTATVFETIMIDMPELGSVCSGGRYDDLAQYYTDRALPGVGISVGITRLFDGLRDAGKLDLTRQTSSQVIILPLEEAAWDVAGQLAQVIRDNAVACEVVYAEAKPAKVFARANKLAVPYVVVIGTDELTKNVVVVKDMATGDQQSLSLEAAVARLTQ